MRTDRREDFEEMVKSFLRRLIAALGIPLIAFVAAPAAARTPALARPALWEVSDPDTTIYLFGTIHLLPEDLQWRTPAFDQAVASSQQLVVETIVDQQNPKSIMDAEMQLGFGKGLPPIAQRVPASKLPLLRAAIAKSRLPEKALDQMDTW